MDSYTPSLAQDATWRPLITALVGLCLCSVYFLYRSALPKPLPGIPYDEAAARNILGSIPSMIFHIRQHGVILPWFASHNTRHNAPLVQFFGAPFAKPTLILCDFQESQDILIRRTKEFDRASMTIGSLQSVIPQHHLAMRSTDPRFKGNKELVRDLMSPSFLYEGSAPQIYEKSLDLIDLWSLKARASNGKPFPACEDIFDTTLDMINAAAFGFEDDLAIVKRQYNHFVSNGVTFDEGAHGAIHFHRLPLIDEIATLRAVSEYLASQLNSPLPKLAHAYSMLTNSKLRRDIAFKDEIIKKQIKLSMQKLQSGDKAPRSATEFMVQREYSVARKEGRDADCLNKRAIDELFGYISGGHETTSATLSWVVKFISDYQSVQDKLRQALKLAFPNATYEKRPPTALEIANANIPYLDAVIEECLRVGQPTPLVAREVMVDTVLLGHRIPKGVNILINSSGPGYMSSPLEIPDSSRSETSQARKHRPWSSENIHSFYPERWLKPDSDGDGVYDSQAGPFLSFSLGPRGCFGKRLAYLKIRIVLTLLLWNFHFKKLDGELVKYDTKEYTAVAPNTCFVGLQCI